MSRVPHQAPYTPHPLFTFIVNPSPTLQTIVLHGHCIWGALYLFSIWHLSNYPMIGNFFLFPFLFFFLFGKIEVKSYFTSFIILDISCQRVNRGIEKLNFIKWFRVLYGNIFKNSFFKISFEKWFLKIVIFLETLILKIFFFFCYSLGDSILFYLWCNVNRLILYIFNYLKIIIYINEKTLRFF